MVAVYVVQRLVKQRDDVFQIIIGQIAAAHNAVHIARQFGDGWPIKAGLDLVADGQDSVMRGGDDFAIGHGGFAAGAVRGDRASIQ
jgi:hypothetical protein